MKREFTVSRLDDSTYAIVQKAVMGQAILYLVVGTERAALIDSGVKSANDLRSVVNEITDKPVIVLHTHGHFDHIGNSALFSELYIHEEEEEVAKAHSDKDYLLRMCKSEVNPLLLFLAKRKAVKMFTFEFPGGCKTFADGVTIDLGGRVLEVIHTPGHTPGSCCFLDRDHKMIFTGDTCCDWGVLLHLEFCQPVEVFLQSMIKLCELESGQAFSKNLPGHHVFPAKDGLPGIYRECAEMIVSKTAAIKRQKHHVVALHDGIRIELPKGQKAMR